MAATCEFNDEIEQQIIIGGTSSKIRKQALRDPKFDLKNMLSEGRKDEQSSYQIKDIESKEPTKVYIQTNSTRNQRKPKRKHVAIAGVNIRTYRTMPCKGSDMPYMWQSKPFC
jgi:hypothetical protein